MILAIDTVSFELTPADNERLAVVCGHLDAHLRMLERGFGVEVNNRGTKFQLIGPAAILTTVQSVLYQLYADAVNEVITSEQVHLLIREAGGEQVVTAPSADDIIIKTKRGLIKARGENQQAYLRRVMTHDINFGVGPAGTGKTYLAVACAVEALERDLVRRIVLVRPAVEAGEKLGFLPGDLTQKVDPYLRPLYDALFEMLGFERVNKLIERNVIEVAPLAYMRGRTLNDAFIILDEAQNTTIEQMKMFLTRLGYHSTAVITGDITQIDLPNHQRSGLRDAITVLKSVEGIGFTFFQAKDVVRHQLVQKVILAYETAAQPT
ncbi:MAG TPA: phosphate starvation-inducible protein PhoH [Gammaproteobacteria bacterium]|nr:phosphate starvation-inducible protein PhoH [Gammaproteobacteria bacterium]